MTMLFTENHEWARVEGDVVTMGITAYAANALGDIVFTEVNPIGETVAMGDACGVVESVKAANDVYAPLSGEIVEINEAIADNPALVNESPEANGWFCKIKISDPAEAEKLLSDDAYKTLIS